MKSTTTIGRLLTRSSGRIERLVARTAILRRLQNAVKQALGGTLGAKCQVVNLRDGNLVLAVPSPAWSARLRTALPDLQRQLASRPGLPAIRQIRVQVSPTEIPTPSNNLSQRAKLSPQAAATISAAASDMRDPKLRDALLRLAGRTGKPDPQRD